MNRLLEKSNPSTELKLQNRLTALWAFSESAFGGLLHLMKIPFRGMILTANATVLLSLISHFSTKKKKILETSLLVVLVKFIVSPYSPLTAYLAVTFQGVTGFFFYGITKMHKVSALFHSVFAQLQSSLQKFIGLTIFFGMTFWYSLDLYIEYIAEKFGILQNDGSNLSYSFIFVMIYVFIHVVFGVFIGIIAGKLPSSVEKKLFENSLNDFSAVMIENEAASGNKFKRKKYWWQRKSGIALISLFIIMALLPFADPELEKGITGNVIYMVARSVIITFVWFAFISPLVVKYLQKYLKRKESLYSDELNDILELIPSLRIAVKSRWNCRKEKRILKLPGFISDLFYTLIFFNMQKSENTSTEEQ